MEDIKYKTVVVKCTNPTCHTNIQLSIGKVPFGINDSGGWILECNSCQTKFPYKVKNPKDYSSVDSGAKILDSWDNEIENSKAEVLKKHNLVNFPDDFHFDNLLFVQHFFLSTMQYSFRANSIR
jgi:hypothetical protein